MNASEIARIINEASPPDLRAFVEARFRDERMTDISHALAILIEIEKQDEAEEETRQRQLRGSFNDLFAALAQLEPPIGRGEMLGDALGRCPPSHPAVAISRRIWKCEACGGLGPLTKMHWAVDADGSQPCCPYCSAVDRIGMWKEPVA